MDLGLIAMLTIGVLGVLLLVLAVIAAVVVVPLVRHRLAHSSESSKSEADVDGVVTDAQAAGGDGAEAVQR